MYYGKVKIKGLGDYIISTNREKKLINDYTLAYNEMCNIANGWLIDKLNKEFDEKNPQYKMENISWETVEYYDWMKKGYEKYILNELNNNSLYNEYLEYMFDDNLSLIGIYKKIKV